MSKRTITVEHNDKVYYGEVMRIKSTTFGYQHHGILTATLHCEAGGTGQGVGGYALDEYSKVGSKRVSTAYGLDHLTQIVKTVGVDHWEGLPGKQVIVLREGESGWGSLAVGIAGLLSDKVLIFEEHAKAWRDSEDAA